MNNLENTSEGMANRGQGLADDAADTLQSGIRDAKHGANSAASYASEKLESARNGIGAAFDEASDQAQGMKGKMTDAAQRTKDFAADTQDTIVAYTREQPVKALLIAAAAGAAFVALSRVFGSSDKHR